MANKGHPAKFRADRSCCYRDMAIFDFSRWRLSAILEFQKFNILTARDLRRANMHQRAKFHADQSSRCGDTVGFLFF